MSSAGTRLRKALKRKRSGGAPKSSRRLFATPYKRPRTMQTTRMVVPVGRGPVPQQTIVTLRYNTVWKSDGTTYDKRFNLNSIYSPEYAGGHQPLGRDQYATFYNRYRVTKVKALIVAGSITTYAGGAIKLVVVPDNATNILSDMIQAQEQRGASVHVSPASNTGPVICRRTFYPHQITGVTATEYKDDRFQPLINTKPTEDIMLHVCLTDLYNNVLTADAVHLTVTLEYTVCLFDPVPLASS